MAANMRWAAKWERSSIRIFWQISESTQAIAEVHAGDTSCSQRAAFAMYPWNSLALRVSIRSL